MQKASCSGWPGCNSNQWYCLCPSGLYPSRSAGACVPCSTIIPFCASCQTYWYSASCKSCQSGYYVSNWGSSCSPCRTGCTTCSSWWSCSKCISITMITISGVCQCNSTQSLYYNPSTNSCTICSSSIVGCTSCSANLTDTSCSACTMGYYLSGGTCIQCTDKCLNCTSTSCSKCPSTFIINATSCICDANAQLFLNANGTQCVSCLTLISNCLTCTTLANGSLSCSACTFGSFFNGTDC